MKNSIKLIIFWILFFYINHTFAMDFWLDKIDKWLINWGWWWLVEVVTNILKYLIWLIYLIAIVFWIYAWFQILTSWGDDWKIKKWKQTLIYVVVWLAVLLLSSVIVNWTIDTLSDKDIIWPTTNSND